MSEGGNMELWFLFNQSSVCQSDPGVVFRWTWACWFWACWDSACLCTCWTTAATSSASETSRTRIPRFTLRSTMAASQRPLSKPQGRLKKTGRTGHAKEREKKKKKGEGINSFTPVFPCCYRSLSQFIRTYTSLTFPAHTHVFTHYTILPIKFGQTSLLHTVRNLAHTNASFQALLEAELRRK